VVKSGADMTSTCPPSSRTCPPSRGDSWEERRLGRNPLARIVGQATSGIAPLWVMMVPVEAVKRLLAKVGWDRDEAHVYGLNEAFALQSIAVIRELRLDPGKVNVNGGAVALGHTIGASGARMLVTLLHEMAARDARKGVPPNGAHSGPYSVKALGWRATPARRAPSRGAAFTSGTAGRPCGTQWPY